MLSFHFEPRPDGLNSLLDLFSQLNLGSSNNNDMASSSTHASSPIEIKLNMPSPFSGKRKDLTKFWQDCCVFTSINDEIYNSDIKKITFVLLLPTEGEAASWKEQFVREAIINCKKCKIPLDFGTFAVFETKFFEASKPFDQTGDAWVEMKEMGFNGPTGHMDEHIACFKSLLTKTGMTDSTAVINCFRETLPQGLQQKILMLPDAPTTLTDWYKWTAKIHHGWQVWNRMIT